MSGKALHEAIREAFGGLTQVQIAERLGVDQTTVSRLVNGRWGKTGGPTLDDLAEIEAAAGRPRGWIAIQAGYVTEVRSVRESVEMDPGLTDSARQILLAYYDGLVQSLQDGRVGRD